MKYRFSVIGQSFFLPKQSQKSRSVLLDRSRSLALFWKGKTHIIAKFLRTDLVIRSHSREGKNLSYSRINTVGCTKHFSSPIEMYLKSFCVRVWKMLINFLHERFLCEWQGTDRRAMPYVDRSCLIFCRRKFYCLLFLHFKGKQFYAKYFGFC